jgi:hypothetical protein
MKQRLTIREIDGSVWDLVSQVPIFAPKKKAIAPIFNGLSFELAGARINERNQFGEGIVSNLLTAFEKFCTSYRFLLPFLPFRQ